MKIVALKTENFKRLSAVEITPDGNLVEIRGRNGQGKSSVLDAIWAALGGKDAVPPMPIKRGADTAKIELNLGELVVTRTFRTGKDGGYTTDLKVTAADGAKFGSPQGMLDKLVGRLAFDPLAFSRMDPKAQFEQLKKLVPGIDFDAIQRADAGDRDRRQELNRKAKDARAAAVLITLPGVGPFTTVDESALVAQLETAGETNTAIEKRRANRETVAASIATKNQDADKLDQRAAEVLAEIERKRLEITGLQAQAVALRNEATELQERLNTAEPLPTPVDTAEIRKLIEAARAANALAARAKLKADHTANAESLEAQAAVITTAIEQRQKDKVAQIAAAQIPVPGIGFGDGEVLLNGVPFGQGSSAEQLRASIGIAAAMNPQLRVIHVRDGSLLDTESLALLAQFAQEHDLQVWAEIVDSKGETGIVIEDGAVRAAAPAEAAA